MKKSFEFLMHLPIRIKKWIQSQIQYNISPTILAWKVTMIFPLRSTPKPHRLPAPLIISLTSYPARFGKLPLTLKCLLSQSIAPDRVILWIAHKDKNALTPAILNLQKLGLEIAYCHDWRSFKKIIPTLQHHPESFIVTADDDLYYCPSWLAEMVESYKGNCKEAICHRAHHICLDKNDLPLPYSQWEYEMQRVDASPLNFQTGGSGVFYPPGIFHHDVLNADIFNALCPNADDVWLYWMMRLNGGIARKIEITHALITWRDTQKTALFHQNTKNDGGNDDQINAMIRFYKFPGSVF